MARMAKQITLRALSILHDSFHHTHRPGSPDASIDQLEGVCLPYGSIHRIPEFGDTAVYVPGLAIRFRQEIRVCIVNAQMYPVDRKSVLRAFNRKLFDLAPTRLLVTTNVLPISPCRKVQRLVIILYASGMMAPWLRSIPWISFNGTLIGVVFSCTANVAVAPAAWPMAIHEA